MLNEFVKCEIGFFITDRGKNAMITFDEENKKVKPLYDFSENKLSNVFFMPLKDTNSICIHVCQICTDGYIILYKIPMNSNLEDISSEEIYGYVEPVLLDGNKEMHITLLGYIHGFIDSCIKVK